MVSTRGVRYKFSEGERVLCYEPDPTKAKVLYDSKVLEVIENKDKRGRRTIEYLIHFQGWNSSWDRCVGEEFVLKDTEENRQLQRDLAEKSQLQLGAYLYRRERKKGSTSGSAGSSAAKRSRHRFSDDGSSSSTQPDEPEGEETANGKQEAGDAEHSQESPEEEIKEEVESDSSESSDDEPVQPGSPDDYVQVPVGRAHLNIPVILRDRLTFDYHLIVKRNCLTRLPASPCAAQILESFVKWFARAGAWNTPRCRNEPPQKPDLTDVSRRLNLVREVADGMRVYFDFIMRGNLLYKPELAQYHQVCGQFLDQQERKMKEELESDGLSQDEYEDDAASAEEDIKSPKIPEYSHLPPDPIQAENGDMLDVNHIKQEIKEEPDEIDEDTEMAEEMDAELQEQMQEAMQQEMQERMQLQMLVDEEMQQQIKEEIEDQDYYQEVSQQGLDEIQEEGLDEIQEEGVDEFQEGLAEIQEEGLDEIQEEGVDEIQEGLEEIQEEGLDEIQEELQDESQEDLQDESQEDLQDEVQENLQDEVQKELQDENQEKLQDDMQEDLQNDIQEDLQGEIQVKQEIQEDLQDEIQVKQEIQEEIQLVVRQEEIQLVVRQEEIPDSKQEQENKVQSPNDNADSIQDKQETKETDNKIVKEEVPVKIKLEKEDRDEHNLKTAHMKCSNLAPEHSKKDIKTLNKVIEDHSQVLESSHTNVTVDHHSQPSEGHREGLRSQTEGHGEGLRSQTEGHREGLRSQTEGHREGLRSQTEGHRDGLRSQIEGHHSRELRSQTSEGHHSRELRSQISEGHSRELRSHASESHPIREGLRSQSMEGLRSQSIEGLRSQSLEGHHSPRSPTEDSFPNTVRRQLHRPNTRSRRGTNSPAVGNSPAVERGNSSPALQRGNSSPAVEEFVDDPHSFANTVRGQMNRPATRGQRRRWNNSPATPAVSEEAPSSNAASCMEAPLITEIKQEPETDATRPATRTRTRSCNRKSTNSPAANLPAVNSPTVNSPAVNSPAVSSPAVNSPAVDSVDSPTVTSAEETPAANTTEDHSLVPEIKQEPRDPETCRPATRSGNVARRLRSRKSAVSQSENEEPQPSTSTAEPRNFEHSSSVGSGSGSSNEEWSKPAEPAPAASSTRTPLSQLLDKVSKYEIIPREGTEHLPCRVYGAIHLARLFVRLPDFLNATQMSDFKLKLVVKHIDMFIQYLVEHKELFGEKFYYCESMSRST